ncbi:MAG: 50S ribosomal protein L15 [Elusimicrobiota bacterium]
MAETTISLSRLAAKPGSRHRKKRLGKGLGSGKGKTCGKGTKGQKSRSGIALSGFEGGQTPLIRRLPKRGFRNTQFRTIYQVVSLAKLSAVFKNQNEVDLEALKVHGLIKGRRQVKILGDGELAKPLKIKAHAFSKSAQEKIQQAGGTIEVIGKAAAG